jgi:beta-N-acetylhexosaminidase
MAAGAVLAAVMVPRDEPAAVPAPTAVSTSAEVSASDVPEAVPAKAEQPARPSCETASAGLTPRQRVAQLLMVGVPAGSVDNALKLVKDSQVGGLFVHANPTKLLTGGRLVRVRAAARIPVTVAVDEEGGRVQTVDPLAGPMPGARQMARTMTPEQVEATAADRGRFLSAAGVTMDFAPVVDVTDRPANTVIGDRSFSSDPHTVKRYASAFASGLSSAGVLPVLKHFPGHGSANGDTHKTTAVTPPLSRLETVDLVPYSGLADYGPVAVMFGHFAVPGLTGNEPATLSPAAYQLLRDKYDFDGLAVTDDLGAMKAITDRYDLPDAVLRAITAGADIALWSSGVRTGEVVDRLEKALRTGELPASRAAEALHRVLASKSICTS